MEPRSGRSTPAEEDSTLVKELEEPPRAVVVETNVLAACCVLALAVALDALNALPAVGTADVPTSLRTTGLVLVAMVAAPPVRPDTLFLQRGGALGLLAAAAWVGLHNGETHARTADALYALVGGSAVVSIFGASGPAKGERGYDDRGKRENLAALAAGFLAYCGFRVLRAGMTHASEVARFTVEHDDLSVPGHALADDLVASALSFGGVVVASASVVILLNHDLVYEHGCAPVCGVLAVLAVATFTAAFVVQISAYARLDELEVLFGETSCSGSADVCAVTFRARRMQAANSSPACLWACAIALVVLAFPQERRCRTRKDYYTPDTLAQQEASAVSAGWAAVVSAGVAVAAILIFAHGDGSTTLPVLELLLLYGSIPLAWFGDSWLACVVHAAGILLYTANRMGSSFGFDLSYLTHWFVASTALLVLILAVTTAISQILYVSCCMHGKYIVWVEWTTALALVALVSSQLLLTTVSLGLVSGYEGARFSDDGRSWRVVSFEWSTQHCISFFFAAALVGGRYESSNPHIPRWALRLVWFGLPIVLIVAWIIAMAADRSDGLPYASLANLLPLAVAVVGALVPWFVIGVVVC